MVVFQNVSEKFRIKFIEKNRVQWEEIWALKDVSFRLGKGEALGIIGHNGAGKTTLLKLIAGILEPDEGQVTVNGRVCALMELGAGFNSEFTGRENITLNARTYGFSDEILKEKMGEIEKFADLGRFIDAPIKHYSQGMYTRLAFALSIFMEPDILLIDDIIAVGDEETQKKCVKRVFEMKKAGTSIIAVSHNFSLLGRLCEKVILLEKGRLIASGDIGQVIPYYIETIGEKKGIAVDEEAGSKAIFNNGRLSVRHNGILVTGAEGINTVVYNPGSGTWNSSADFAWEATASAGLLKAKGVLPDGNLVQEWIVKREPKALRIIARFDADGERHFDFFLNCGFSRYELLDAGESFPPFVHKTRCQDLGQDRHCRGMIGFAPGKESALPWVAVELPDDDSYFKLFNTGYDLECRYLQLYSSGRQLEFLLRFFEDQAAFERYLDSARKAYRDQMQAQAADLKKRLAEREEQLKAERTIRCGDLSLFADEANSAVRLYYKGEEVTAGNGVHVAFLSEGVWSGLSDALSWSLHREGDMLLLAFVWPRGDRVSWTLKAKEKGIEWSAQARFAGPVELVKLGVAVQAGYKRYFCGREEGIFPGIFTGWNDLTLADPLARVFGVRRHEALPAVTLENSSCRCVIQNGDERSRCRTVQLQARGEDIPDGVLEMRTFIGLTCDERGIEEFIVGERERFEEQRRLQEERFKAERTVACGELSVYADEKRSAVRLYYKGEEITAGGGVHVAFFGENAWYGLPEAKWEVLKKDSVLLLELSWERGDRVRWALAVQDHAVRWETQAHFAGPVELFTQGVCVRGEYRRYFCGKEERVFPGSSAAAEEMNLAMTRASMLGVRMEPPLPAVTLENGRKYGCALQNGPKGSGYRLLQLCVTGSSIDEGGFEMDTVIGVVEDERAIDAYIDREKKGFELERRLEEEKLKAERSVACGDLGLFADETNSSLRVYYKGGEITEGNGVHVSFLSGDRWFGLADAFKWSAVRTGSRLSLVLWWPRGDRLDMLFTVRDDGIQWEAQARFAEKPVLVKFGIALKARYKRYFCGSGEGSLPAVFKEWSTVALEEPVARLFGLRAQGDLPAVALSNEDGRSCLIQTGNEESRCRILQLQSEAPDIRGDFLALRTVIAIGMDERPVEEYIAAEKERRKAERTVTCGGLSVYADEKSAAVRVFHDGKEITAGDGIHVSFLREGAWYGMSAALWSVSRKDTELLLEFLWESGDRLRCSLNVREEGILWATRANFSRTPEMLKLGIAVRGEYRRYFCGREEGSFPAAFLAWKDIPLAEPSARLFGLRGESPLPALTLSNKGFTCMMQNSDGASRCRILQMAVQGAEIGDGTLEAETLIGIPADESGIGEYIRSAQEVFLAGREGERRQATLYDGATRLFIDVVQKKLRIWHGDDEITAAEGFNCSHDVRRGSWRCQRRDERSLLLIVDGDPSLEFIFTLESPSRIFVEAAAGASAARNLMFMLKLDPRYLRWVTHREEGVCSGSFIGDIAPVRMKNNKVSRIMVKDAGEQTVSLDASAQQGNIMSLNLERSSGALCVSCERVLSYAERTALTGPRRFFNGSILIGENSSLPERTGASALSLSCGGFRVEFDEGRARVFRDGGELTSGLGLYTSVRVMGIWYDSGQACWNVRKTEDGLFLSGDWPVLPIGQEWQLRGISGGVELSVRLKVYEPVALELEQAGMMLVTAYTEWSSGAVSGIFTDSFTSLYDILPFRFWSGEPSGGTICARGNGVPETAFACEAAQAMTAIIENSDSFYRSRLLQFQRNGRRLEAGEYDYFKGVIRFSGGEKR